MEAGQNQFLHLECYSAKSDVTVFCVIQEKNKTNKQQCELKSMTANGVSFFKGLNHILFVYLDLYFWGQIPAVNFQSSFDYMEVYTTQGRPLPQLCETLILQQPPNAPFVWFASSMQLIIV